MGQGIMVSKAPTPTGQVIVMVSFSSGQSVTYVCPPDIAAQVGSDGSGYNEVLRGSGYSVDAGESSLQELLGLAGELE